MPHRCPHCAAPTRIRKSEYVSRTARQGALECKNLDCGWRGKYVLEITHTLAPSLVPSAAVDIPLSPAIARQLTPGSTG